MRRGRWWLWIAGAVLLLGVGALLSRLADDKKGTPERDIDFPRRMRSAERERAAKRRTLAPVPAVYTAPAPGAPPRPRDPFLLALPRNSRSGVVVLEANALRHSRIGELFVSCIGSAGGKNPLDEMREEAGIDPLKDVDRVAVGQDGFVVSGFFDRARFDDLLEESRVESYGEHGRVYYEPGGSNAPALGVWGGQLIAFGSGSFVRETLDRLEGGGGEDAPPPIPEDLTYGEAYGVVPGSALQELFTGAQSDLGRRLAEVAQRIELHADAMDDLALVARVSGEDAAKLDDLATAFGAALSVARMDARIRGQEEASELLEHALVRRHDGGFSLELALPIEVVERWFAGCGSGSRESGSER